MRIEVLHQNICNSSMGAIIDCEYVKSRLFKNKRLSDISGLDLFAVKNIVQISGKLRDEQRTNRFVFI